MSTAPDRSQFQRTARVAVNQTSKRDGMEAMARAGLVARGVIYGIVGILAFKLALGAGGKTESQTGAMKTLAHQTFGNVLLIVLAIGLAGYAIWRLITAVVGIRKGEDGALGRRVAALGSGIAYAVLCFVAITIIAGGQGSSGSPKHAASGILGWPAGPVIVAIIGLVVVGIGLYQAYKGLSRNFEDDSHVERMADPTHKAFTTVGVTGHVARAVIFLLIGYGLIKAALDYSAKSAVGLDGALQKLAHASAGRVLLGIVALGFIAFALYSIVDARYHKV